MRQFGRQKQHIEQCTVVKNRRLHEVGKRYRRSATVCRMTGYFLIVERICYVAIITLNPNICGIDGQLYQEQG
jgi:hypothetical protein